MLTTRGLTPVVLQLEITEEFLMADRDRAKDILSRLRENGIQISVDDFGTGYSSLAYLRDLPIDELKLDRSFVLPMSDDPRAAALVASNIAFGAQPRPTHRRRGRRERHLLTQLTRLGCDQAQGFFMSKPVAPDQLDHWLEDQTAAARSIIAAADAVVGAAG